MLWWILGFRILYLGVCLASLFLYELFANPIYQAFDDGPHTIWRIVLGYLVPWLIMFVFAMLFHIATVSENVYKKIQFEDEPAMTEESWRNNSAVFWITGVLWVGFFMLIYAIVAEGFVYDEALMSPWWAPTITGIVGWIVMISICLCLRSFDFKTGKFNPDFPGLV